MFRTVFRRGRLFPRPVGVGARQGFSRAYNYSHFQTLHAGPSKFKRFITVNLYLVSITAFAYYMWWPKHTFPPSVAKILRKGLWAESDKGEKDYQLALKHYIEALDKCEELHLDPLSDEYTGIQLKVGEMYERLGMMEEAAFVYNEIATLYLSVLTAARNSKQGGRIKSIDHRAHLIQKDLRVALKLVELNRENTSLSKAILITHLLIAQEEINRKLGLEAAASSLLTPDGTLGQKIEKIKSGKLDKMDLDSLDSEVANAVGDNKTENVVILETNPEAFEPFADEYFNALDVLCAICIAVGDIKTASSIRVAVTSKMLMAGVSPDKLLLSQCNSGSLLYFQAGKLQAEEQNLRRKFAEEAGVDYKKLKAIHDPLQPTKVSDKEAEEIREKIAQVVSPEDKRDYEAIIENKNKLMEMVIATYESVISGSKKLPQELVKENQSILEAVALATYGLGVVNLHLSLYDKAERLLREARVRSKACHYDALIEEIERELQKVFNERNAIKSKKDDVSMDIQMMK